MSGARRKGKSKASMPLAEFVETYISSRLALKASTAEQYRFSRLAFEKFLGRPGVLGDLNEETITAYVRKRLETCSAGTAKRDRNSLVIWWRFAARQKWLPAPPLDGVPTVKVPRRIPTAWTLEQVGKILETCGRMTGRLRGEHDSTGRGHYDGQWLSGPERSKFWTALILFLYDTGTRISAAMEVTPADIDLDRGLVTLRSDAAKTGIEQVLRLSRQTVEAIRGIYDPQAKRLFAWHYSPRRMFVKLGEILRMAGLPHDSKRKFHCLRRTCATLTAAAGRRDLAQQTLGHTTISMTMGYIDRRQLPIQSAADVLPRPACPTITTPAPAPDQKPDAVAVALSSLSPQQLETVVALAKALFGVSQSGQPKPPGEA